MRRPLTFTAVLLLSVALVGCASPSFVIYPASNQGQEVEKVVRGGYTFLRSEKEGSVATVSLRRATGSYVQTYVSISNKESSSFRVVPQNVMVETIENGQTFSAYSPEEAPTVVQRAAEGSRRSFLGMNSLNVTGNTAMGGETGEAGSTGSYGSDSEPQRSYLDLMLKEQTLAGQQATSGLVFTPFSTGISAFQMTVPAGNTTHTFRFTVRQGE